MYMCVIDVVIENVAQFADVSGSCSWIPGRFCRLAKLLNAFVFRQGQRSVEHAHNRTAGAQTEGWTSSHRARQCAQDVEVGIGWSEGVGWWVQSTTRVRYRICNRVCCPLEKPDTACRTNGGGC